MPSESGALRGLLLQSRTILTGNAAGRWDSWASLRAYAVFLQGIHPPTARPMARATSPQAVGFGRSRTSTAAKKKNNAEMQKNIGPIASSLNSSTNIRRMAA